MSDFVNKPGLGTMFANRDKKGESHPDYRGSITLNSGEVVNFAGWKKEGNKGSYLSLKIDKPREDDFRSSGAAPVAGRDVQVPADDDFPF